MDLIEPLTTREMHTLRLLSLGYSNSKIASLMLVNEETVKFHLSNVYGKLGARSRTHAVAIAVACGLVEI